MGKSSDIKMNKANAIIMAGTHADKTKLVYGQNKAFFKINGKEIVLNVLHALQNCNLINQDKIAVVGPKIDLEKIISGVQIIEESTNKKESIRFIENVTRSYDFVSPNGERTLYLPADLPKIDENTLKDFLEKCNNKKNKHAALYISLIKRENIPKDIEGLKRSAKFHLYGKGFFRTANMTLYEGDKIKDRAFIESKFRMAFPLRRPNSWYAKAWLYTFVGAIYPKEMIWEYLIRKNLTEQDVENAFRRKPGFEFKFVETTDPKAVMDIDYENEADHLKKVLESNN